MFGKAGKKELLPSGGQQADAELFEELGILEKRKPSSGPRG